MGDFNEIQMDSEKYEGFLRPAWQIKAFNDVLRDCNFTEILITCLSLTWMRGNRVGKIMERLNKGVVNSSFLISFPSIYKAHIAKDSSDHLQILFKFISLGDVAKPQSKLFRFENLWLMHEFCEDVVKSNWIFRLILIWGSGL